VGFAPTFYFARKKMSKPSIEQRIREIATAVAEENKLVFVHSEVFGSSKDRTVRIFIDKVGGVTHDDCAAVSGKVSELIDEEDFIPTAFTLEVSSPGLERGLYSLEDFKQFSGKLAQFKSYHAIDGQKHYNGRIVGIESGFVVFEDNTNGIVKIPHSAIAKANLVIDLEEEFKKAKVSN
jgi:ribosome maturation factor RimP